VAVVYKMSGIMLKVEFLIFFRSQRRSPEKREVGVSCGTRRRLEVVQLLHEPAGHRGAGWLLLPRHAVRACMEREAVSTTAAGQDTCRAFPVAQSGALITSCRIGQLLESRAEQGRALKRTVRVDGFGDVFQAGLSRCDVSGIY
jgi:hypothetical protein